MGDGVAALQHILTTYAEDIEQVMLEADWEKLATILQQRQAFMEQKIFSLANKNENTALVGAIEKIQAEDRVFLSSLLEKKQELEKKLRYIRYGKKSIKAYEV